jgi:spermidine/putrescine transport system permease protein
MGAQEWRGGVAVTALRKSLPTYLSAHTTLTYLFLYAPIAVLVVYSFNAGRDAFLWRGFSTQPYRALAEHRALLDATRNSLIVAAAAAAVSTLIGTLAAIGLDRYRFRGRVATSALLYLPMVIPEIVLGASLLTFFLAAGVEEMNLGTVILAHIAFTVSYVTVVVRARLAGLDRSVEEAAMDLGAGPVGAFCRVTLPRLAPGIVAGALLAFTVSLDDYVVTSLVSGVDSRTLPVQVYSLLRGTVPPTVNAACTALLAVTVVLAAVAQRLLGK